VTEVLCDARVTYIFALAVLKLQDTRITYKVHTLIIQHFAETDVSRRQKYEKVKMNSFILLTDLTVHHLQLKALYLI
jgi:hypothetical protein